MIDLSLICGGSCCAENKEQKLSIRDMLISSFTRRCVAQQGRGSSVSCKLQRYLLPKETTKNIAHLRQQQQIRERHNVVYFSSSSDKDALVQIEYVFRFDRRKLNTT